MWPSKCFTRSREINQTIKKFFLVILFAFSFSVAESEPVEPKLFEMWSHRVSLSLNYLFNKYLLQSIGGCQDEEKKLISADIETYFLWHYCYRYRSTYSFKWQYRYMDGAGAKIWEKGGAGAEKNNFTGLLSSVSAAEPAPFFFAGSGSGSSSHKKQAFFHFNNTPTSLLEKINLFFSIF